MEVELCDNVSLREGPVAKWIRHLTTNQEIAGSSPARVKLFSSDGDFFTTLGKLSIAIMFQSACGKSNL